MGDDKYMVGYPSGSGIAGGRQRETEVTFYSDEAGIWVPAVKVPWSEDYDCTEVAWVIADYLNNK